MKRKNEKVPGFDEIIFENRNQEYGAYNLRKSYNSTTSISILGGIAFCGLLIAVFAFTTEKGTAFQGPIIDVFLVPDPIFADPVRTDPKPTAELAGIIKNVAPVVTEDSLKDLNLPPSTDDLVKRAKDKGVDEPVVYEEPENTVLQPKTEPFILVEEMPEFPGGDAELLNFISKNISYPEDAIRNNIQGRVILKFAVNTDGSIDRIQILRGIDNSLDSEAVRVVRTLPKFKPGKQQGVPVPVWFCLPVLFRLENN
jgi:protein TonB